MPTFKPFNAKEALAGKLCAYILDPKNPDKFVLLKDIHIIPSKFKPSFPIWAIDEQDNVYELKADDEFLVMFSDYKMWFSNLYEYGDEPSRWYESLEAANAHTDSSRIGIIRLTIFDDNHIHSILTTLNDD